jgi:hypothetical protein
MVGRYRIKEGITFPNNISANIREFNIDTCLRTGEYIDIFAHRPGSGKTTTVLRYLKKKINEDKDFKFFYFTDRHEAILEHTKHWDKDTYAHWEGFNRICKRPKMLSYYKYHLNSKEICSLCKKKCSRYITQFNNTSRVFAPFEFLHSKDFKENPPDIIFLDENIKKFRTYTRDIDDAITLLKYMNREDLLKLLEDNDFKTLRNKFDIDKFSKDYKNYILKLAEHKSKNKKELEFVGKFNIFDFYQYIIWESIYGYGLKSYAIPELYYEVFNTVVSKGVPAVFMDATFNPSLFCYLLECYNYESKFIGKKKFNNLLVRGFVDDEDDIIKKSIIYRMRPEDSMPKSGFIEKERWKHTKDWLSEHMKFIMNIFNPNHVGIITYKDLGDFPNAIGLNVECYGNLRGTNKLEDKPVLVLIGSYLPIVASWDAKKKSKEKKYFDELLSEHFFLKIDESNLESIGIGAPEEVSDKYKYKLAKIYGYRYTGKKGKLLGTLGDEIVNHPAEALATLFWYDEVYQAFHRNRALLWEKIIFAYCWFPEPGARIFSTDSNNKITDNIIRELKVFKHDIRDECEIDKINSDIKNDTLLNDFFDLLSEYEKYGLAEELIKDLLYNSKINTHELQEKYRLHKEDGGADTKPITQVKRGLKSFSERAKRVNEFSPVEDGKK